MTKPNSVAHIRKALKGATLKVYASRSRGVPDILTMSLNIFVNEESWDSPRCFLVVEAQANDTTHPNSICPNSRHDATLVPLKGMNGWYAAHSDVRMDFGWGCEGYQSPTRNANFIKLIKPQMDTYRTAYPDCEISRLVLALAHFGATYDLNKDLTVDEQSVAQWNGRR